MNLKILLCCIACVSLPALAAPQAEKENETRRMREREASRARELAQGFADKQDFTEKNKHLMDSEPELFAAALDKRLLASKAWLTAADGLAKIDRIEQAAALKAPAQNAEDIAEIARMELRAAAAEKEWTRTAQKLKSRELETLAGQLIRNQREIIQSTKQRMLGQRQLRQLEIERLQLTTTMRELLDKNREDDVKKREKGGKKPSPDRDKDKNSGHESPAKALVE